MPHGAPPTGPARRRRCVLLRDPLSLPCRQLANCTAIFRLPGGNITAQTTAVPGPPPKQLALTGGTGTYRTIGGDGTLVEFAAGNGGKLTFHVLSLVSRGEGG
jgi:hypothetical protein